MWCREWLIGDCHQFQLVWQVLDRASKFSAKCSNLQAGMDKLMSVLFVDVCYSVMTGSSDPGIIFYWLIFLQAQQADLPIYILRNHGKRQRLFPHYLDFPLHPTALCDPGFSTSFFSTLFMFQTLISTFSSTYFHNSILQFEFLSSTVNDHPDPHSLLSYYIQ